MKRRAHSFSRDHGGRPAGRPSPAARAALLLAAAALAAVAGCGLFDIRDPLTPVDPEDIPHRTANHPDSVVFNFAAGFGYKSIGDAAMRSALSDSFHLVLDLIDSGGVPDSLTKSETATGLGSFFRSVVKADSVWISIELRAAIDSTQRGDIWFYDQVPYTVTNQTKKQTLCAGQSDLYFIQEKGQWYLVSWHDQSDLARAPLTLGARVLPGSGHGSE